MGDYIIRGHDRHTFSTPADRKEIQDPARTKRRHRKEALSVEGYIENPVHAKTSLLSSENEPVYTSPKRLPIRRPTYDEEGNLLDLGDAADLDGNPIPQFFDLWDSIDRLKLASTVGAAAASAFPSSADLPPWQPTRPENCW